MLIELSGPGAFPVAFVCLVVAEEPRRRRRLGINSSIDTPLGVRSIHRSLRLNAIQREHGRPPQHLTLCAQHIIHDDPIIRRDDVANNNDAVDPASAAAAMASLVVDDNEEEEEDDDDGATTESGNGDEDDGACGMDAIIIIVNLPSNCKSKSSQWLDTIIGWGEGVAEEK
jgi:hypothetical protein